MEISTEITLVGEDMEGAQPDAPESRMITIGQDLFEEEGDPFGKGPRAGELHGFVVLSKGDRLVKCDLTFALDGGSLEAHGLLPRENGDFGPGLLAVTGGTGKYHKATGSVTVETKNPKRYSIGL